MNLVEELQSCTWQGFEKIISEVLTLHNFSSYWNVNVTIDKTRRQFDVVANKKNYSLLIECKKWCNKKSKVSALKKAVEKHKKRCKFYGQLFCKKVIPLIVTYNEEPVTFHNGVFIVSINKLNSFSLK